MGHFENDVRKWWPKHADKILGLIRGRIDPLGPEFPKTANWVSQCYHEPRLYSKVLSAINELLGGYGVEGIDPSAEWEAAYENARQAAIDDGAEVNADDIRSPIDDWLSYISFGDSYDVTIIYDHATGEFHVDCWPDFVENYRNECEDCGGEGLMIGIGNRESKCRACRGFVNRFHSGEMLGSDDGMDGD